MFDTVKKEATEAKTTLRNIESTTSAEEKKKIEDNFKNKVDARQKAISDAEQRNDTTQTESLTKTKKDFEEFQKDFSDEMNNLLKTTQETIIETTQNTADKTNNFAKEIASNIRTYTTEELKILTKKTWKELWTDIKYIKTIQQIIIDTGAKHNSISNEILTNGIYGRGTKAGIKTLQEYLNKKYNANLDTDGLAGPATLEALLTIDENKTRLDKIITNHKDIIPLEPESIKSATTKKKIPSTGGGGAVGISNPTKTKTEKDRVDGQVNDKTLTREEVLKNPAKYNIVKNDDGTLHPAKGYTRINNDNKNDFKTKQKDYTQENIKEVKDKNLITVTEQDIQKGLGTYLKNSPIIFGGTNSQMYIDYYNKKTKGGTIKFGKGNPSAQENSLFIGSLQIELKPSDYLKTDYSVNYESLIEAIKKSVIQKANKEQTEKNDVKLSKDSEIIRKYLQNTKFSIDNIFPKKEQHPLVKSFFKMFENEMLEFDRNYYDFSKENGGWLKIEFDKDGRNNKLGNDKNPYGEYGMIALNNKTINGEPNKIQLHKDIKEIINKKIKKVHPDYIYKK